MNIDAWIGVINIKFGCPFFCSTAPNEDPDGDGVTFTLNLRFPGQYYDAESGLYYNYFRYYDPSTGRYITSDPTGLGGGLNTYGYVDGNPLLNIDILGLDTIAIGGQVSANAFLHFDVSLQLSLSWNKSAIHDLSQWRIGGIFSSVPYTGASAGFGGAAGLLVTYTMAIYPELFIGKSGVFGVSGGRNLVVGYDVGNEDTGKPKINNLFIVRGAENTPPGLPLEFHGGTSWTAAKSNPL